MYPRLPLGLLVMERKTVEFADREAVEPTLVGSSSRGKKIPPNTLEELLDSTVARVMHAIRIEVDGEFRALEALLGCIFTFHSGEDRRVKKAFKQGCKAGQPSSWSRDVQVQA